MKDLMKMLFADSEGGGGTTDGGKDKQADKQNRNENAIIEVFPVGRYGPQPDVDDPIYYKSNKSADGKMTVGPFNLTARDFRDWADSVDSNDLDEMVRNRELRPATAMTVKSDQFRTIIDMLGHNQPLSESTIRRVLPGDLQRAVEDFKNQP